MLTDYRIGESDDELERMLEVLRFWFTKDLVSSFISSHAIISNLVSRNTLKVDHANRTTQLWENSFVYVLNGFHT